MKNKIQFLYKWDRGKLEPLVTTFEICSFNNFNEQCMKPKWYNLHARHTKLD